jgi:hypothetical protein
MNESLAPKIPTTILTWLDLKLAVAERRSLMAVTSVRHQYLGQDESGQSAERRVRRPFRYFSLPMIRGLGFVGSTFLPEAPRLAGSPLPLGRSGWEAKAKNSGFSRPLILSVRSFSQSLVTS